MASPRVEVVALKSKGLRRLPLGHFAEEVVEVVALKSKGLRQYLRTDGLESLRSKSLS